MCKQNFTGIAGRGRARFNYVNLISITIKKKPQPYEDNYSKNLVVNNVFYKNKCKNLGWNTWSALILGI